jgi:hypothetical protein
MDMEKGAENVQSWDIGTKKDRAVFVQFFLLGTLSYFFHIHKEKLSGGAMMFGSDRPNHWMISLTKSGDEKRNEQ